MENKAEADLELQGQTISTNGPTAVRSNVLRWLKIGDCDGLFHVISLHRRHIKVKWVSYGNVTFAETNIEMCVNILMR